MKELLLDKCLNWSFDKYAFETPGGSIHMGKRVSHDISEQISEKCLKCKYKKVHTEEAHYDSSIRYMARCENPARACTIADPEEQRPREMRPYDHIAPPPPPVPKIPEGFGVWQ